MSEEKQDLAEFMNSGQLPTIADSELAPALVEAIQESGGSQVNYIYFSGKSGSYNVGRDKEPMDPEQLYVAEPASLKRGFICWKGNTVAERVEWLAIQKHMAVRADDLPDHGPYNDNEGWQESMGFGMCSLDNNNDQYEFNSSSASGRNSIKDFFSECSRRMINNEPAIPVFTFDSEKFTAQGNTNFKPKFKIAIWTTRELVKQFFKGEIKKAQLLKGSK